MKWALITPVMVPSAWSLPVESIRMVKFSPPESPANVSVSPVNPPVSLKGSPCGQSSVPVMVFFLLQEREFHADMLDRQRPGARDWFRFRIGGTGAERGDGEHYSGDCQSIHVVLLVHFSYRNTASSGTPNTSEI
jgi:hypothetical protein